MNLTAKELARATKRRPKWIRKVLRQNFSRGRGKRWEWEGRRAEKVKAWFVRYLNGSGK
jgi:hypothetical protein